MKIKITPNVSHFNSHDKNINFGELTSLSVEPTAVNFIYV